MANFSDIFAGGGGGGSGVGTVVIDETELAAALALPAKYIRIGASFSVAAQQVVSTAGTLIVSDDPAYVVTHTAGTNLFNVTAAECTFRDLNLLSTVAASDLIELTVNECMITNCRFELDAASTGSAVVISGDENIVSSNHMTITTGTGATVTGNNNAVGPNVIV